MRREPRQISGRTFLFAMSVLLSVNPRTMTTRGHYHGNGGCWTTVFVLLGFRASPAWRLAMPRQEFILQVHFLYYTKASGSKTSLSCTSRMQSMYHDGGITSLVCFPSYQEDGESTVSTHRRTPPGTELYAHKLGTSVRPARLSEISWLSLMLGVDAATVVDSQRVQPIADSRQRPHQRSCS
ncbi:hypothetical protein B0H34DRAFT_370341 [Crassisporium funariophilum]|nr:hypothetical protein B0H34DRAFT_370341 [Crassisporium funariophilum]